MLRPTPFRVDSGDVVFYLACLMVACDSAPSVAIGPPGRIADAAVTDPADAGGIPDATPSPLPPGETPFERKTTLVDPPGLVDGAAAEAVLAHAPFAVYGTLAGVDAFSFAPLHDGVWGEVRPLTPDRGRGYGRGAGAVAELGVSAAAGAVIVGFDDWNAQHFDPHSAEPWLKSGGGPGVYPVAWYRAALDGADAAAPRTLFESMEALTPFSVADDGRAGFVATPDGIWHVPLDGEERPSLRWAAAADTRVSALELGADRLAFIEFDLAQMRARLRSIPLTDDGGEAETLVDLGEFSTDEVPDAWYAAKDLRRVDDHHVWVQTREHDDLVDLSGARPPLALREPLHLLAEVHIVGANVVLLRSAEQASEVAVRPLDGSNADRATVLGPGGGIVVGRNVFAWLSGDGLEMARGDGQRRRTISLNSWLAPRPRFAFGPDGETLVVCNGSTAAFIPPGADVATALPSGGGSVCDLGLAGALGQIGVFEWGDPSAPGLSTYTLEGAPVARVDLPGQRDCGLTQAGALCRRRHREMTLRLSDGGRDAELHHETNDDGWTAPPELTPGGHFAVVRSAAAGLPVRAAAFAVGGPPSEPVALESRTVGYRPDAQIARREVGLGGAISLVRVPLDTGVASATVLDLVSVVLADLPRAGGVLARAWVDRDVPGDLVFVVDDGRGTRTLLPANDVPEFVGWPVSVAAPGGSTAIALMTRTPDTLDVSFFAPENGASAALGTAHLPAGGSPRVFGLPTPGHALVAVERSPSDALYRVEFSANGDAPRVVDLSVPGAEAMGAEVVLGAMRLFGPTLEDHGVVLAEVWADPSDGPPGRRLYAVDTRAAPGAAWTPLLPESVEACQSNVTSDGRHALVEAEDGKTLLVPTDGRGEARALFTRWSDGSGRGTCPSTPMLAPRLDARGRLVYIEPDTSRLIALDRDTGASETRFDPGSTRGELSIEALTPDGDAAVIRWHGPTGRRLYVVTLTGPAGAAALGPGDLDRDERWIGFGAPAAP